MENKGQFRRFVIFVLASVLGIFSNLPAQPDVTANDYKVIQINSTSALSLGQNAKNRMEVKLPKGAYLIEESRSEDDKWILIRKTEALKNTIVKNSSRKYLTEIESRDWYFLNTSRSGGQDSAPFYVLGNLLDSSRCTLIEKDDQIEFQAPLKSNGTKNIMKSFLKENRAENPIRARLNTATGLVVANISTVIYDEQQGLFKGLLEQPKAEFLEKINNIRQLTIEFSGKLIYDKNNKITFDNPLYQKELAAQSPVTVEEPGAGTTTDSTKSFIKWIVGFVFLVILIALGVYFFQRRKTRSEVPFIPAESPNEFNELKQVLKALENYSQDEHYSNRLEQDLRALPPALGLRNTLEKIKSQIHSFHIYRQFIDKLAESMRSRDENSIKELHAVINRENDPTKRAQLNLLIDDYRPLLVSDVQAGQPLAAPATVSPGISAGIRNIAATLELPIEPGLSLQQQLEIILNKIEDLKKQYENARQISKPLQILLEKYQRQIDRLTAGSEPAVATASTEPETAVSPEEISTEATEEGVTAETISEEQAPILQYLDESTLKDFKEYLARSSLATTDIKKEFNKLVTLPISLMDLLTWLSEIYIQSCYGQSADQKLNRFIREEVFPQLGIRLEFAHVNYPKNEFTGFDAVPLAEIQHQKPLVYREALQSYNKAKSTGQVNQNIILHSYLPKIIRQTETGEEVIRRGKVVVP